MDKNAFPSVIPNVGVDYADIPGLTRRELFAAMAMQGLLIGDSEGRFNTIAGLAVLYADALIEALEESTVTQIEAQPNEAQ